MKHHPCLNCGHSVYEKYCPNCGQKGDIHRINWHYLWHDIPHSIFHLDKGFFRTALDLVKKPGEMIRDFLDGKRATYFRPLMYLIITGSFAGLIYLNVPYESMLARDEETMNLLHDLQKIQAKYMNIINIGLIPIFSFFVWLFYKRERNYVEIAMAHFFMMGQQNLFAVFALMYFVPLPLFVLFSLSALFGFVSFLFTVWTYYSMFTSRSSRSRLIIAFVLWFIQIVFGTIVVLAAGVAYAVSKSPTGEIYFNYGL